MKLGNKTTLTFLEAPQILHVIVRRILNLLKVMVTFEWVLLFKKRFYLSIYLSSTERERAWARASTGAHTCERGGEQRKREKSQTPCWVQSPEGVRSHNPRPPPWPKRKSGVGRSTEWATQLLPTVCCLMHPCRLHARASAAPKGLSYLPRARSILPARTFAPSAGLAASWPGRPPAGSGRGHFPFRCVLCVRSVPCSILAIPLLFFWLPGMCVIL